LGFGFQLMVVSLVLCFNQYAGAAPQPDQLRHLQQALRQRDETIGVLQVLMY
jgi:hypothetical protein